MAGAKTCDPRRAFPRGVRSKEKSIKFIDSLLGFLPQMLALSTSSPYWLGDDTGLASIRSKIFEVMPTSGLPPWMQDWAAFERFMTALIKAETIRSVKEVWWDIRPHPTYGTIEFRMCDGIPTLREVRSIAALAQALVVWMDQQVDAGEPLPDIPSWVARENKWRASRFGLDGRVMTDVEWEHPIVQGQHRRDRGHVAARGRRPRDPRCAQRRP